MFGLEDNESFHNAILGDGIPYFVVSNSKLNEGKADKDIFIFDGYLFPIIVNNRTVCTLCLKQENSSWIIFSVSSDTTVFNNLTKAQELIPENIEQHQEMIIYDLQYNIDAILYNESTEYKVMPLRDSIDLSLQKFKQQNMENIIGNISEVHKNIVNSDGQIGGAGLNSGQSNSFFYITLAMISVSLFSVLLIIFLRNKRENTKKNMESSID